MTNNDILKKVRYALDIKDTQMKKIFKLANYNLTQNELLTYYEKEDSENYKNCTDKTLNLFLDGLIIKRRGKKSNEK